MSENDRAFEDKIRDLVMEVISRYFKKKILAVFTGGTIGRDEAVKQLIDYKTENDVSVDLLFSGNGASVQDVEGLSGRFEGKVFVDGRDRIENWKEYKTLVIAVMTRNTAAKAASLTLDNHIVELMIDASMYGMPVVAIRDAADPRAPGWEKIGLNRAKKGLLEAFDANLKRLEAYGIILCWSYELGNVLKEVLAGGCQKLIGPSPQITSEGSSLSICKKLVTLEDLLPYAGDRFPVIEIPGECIITPLAMDFIRQRNLNLVRR